MNNHEKINYVEFPCTNIKETKTFFEKVFSWKFREYGPEYIAFSDEGLDGGFFKSEQVCSTKKGSALIVFYSNDLQSTKEKIQNAKGTIIKGIYSFPGGSRFHFSDPSGNEYAVWTDTIV